MPERLRLNCFVVLLLLWGMLCSPLMAVASGKSDQLRRTMADISLMSGQMAQRKTDAVEIRDQLTQRLQELREEVRLEAETRRITTVDDAMAQPRIMHDLLLMAEINAYQACYSQKINFYRVAYDRLGYLYQRADDDLKIVNTLSDLKIEALLAQAEKVLDGYLPHAQTIVLQSDTLTVGPPEALWKTIGINPKP